MDTSGDASAQSVSAISGGTNDTSHTAVVGIVITAPGFTSICSGTLIAPNLVLTARHCVSELSQAAVICERFADRDGEHAMTTTTAPYAASAFHVTTDAAVSRNAAFHAVAEVLIPPGSTGVSLCGSDIALLRLTRPITTVAPMEPRLDSAPIESESYTAVGYGITVPDGGDQGMRRVRSDLTIARVGILETEQGIEYQSDAEWNAFTGTCSGDSGGPALDSASRVFGVLSRGASGSCNSPVYERVDSWADWIREQTRSSAGIAGFDLPAWIDPMPAQPTSGSGATSPPSCSTAPPGRVRSGSLAVGVFVLIVSAFTRSRIRGSREGRRRSQ